MTNHDKLRARWEADSPKPSDDFTDKVMQRIAAGQGGKGSRRLWWWSIAAVGLLLVTLTLWIDTDDTQLPVIQVVQTEKTETTETAKAEFKVQSSKFKVQSSKFKVQPSDVTAMKKVAKAEHNTPTLPTAKAEHDTPTQPTAKIEKNKPKTIYADAASSANECLHYASYEEKPDTDYRAPALVDDFIEKFADFYGVKGEALYCADRSDTTVVSMAYVFPDKKEVDVFRRLLMIAVTYDDLSPGYLLNYSHRQVFFQLKDLHLGLKYLWIAERVGGRILLYATHSPIEAEVSSDCFREYRDKLTNTNIHLTSKAI